MTLREFSEETSSESPAPGGGSVSAACGALGISLATMVANLSSHKRGWDERWEEFSIVAEKGMEYQQELLELVDADTEAFNLIMNAYSMPKATKEEKDERHKAIQRATINAIEVPLRTAKVSLESMSLILEMAEKGNPNSITDAGVGALCARTAVLGAVMNVKINMADVEDREYAERITAECNTLVEEAEKLEREVRNRVEESFGE
jgi:glutamate formiminotransferase/formiminotetrahydrofolate cyclodeaminase